MEVDTLPIYKSYWVIPGRFRAGEYPGSIQDDEARGKIRWLLDLGINLFLDLTVAGEYDLKPYIHLLNEESNKVHKSVVHKRIPIQDFSTPTQREMAEIIDTIELALSERKNIYLHCFGGRGRTGTVVGCHLARHGTLGEAALARIQELRKGMPNEESASPETDEQRRMVMEWLKGQ